jgi:hypothetical protein
MAGMMMLVSSRIPRMYHCRGRQDQQGPRWLTPAPEVS